MYLVIFIIHVTYGVSNEQTLKSVAPHAHACGKRQKYENIFLLFFKTIYKIKSSIIPH